MLTGEMMGTEEGEGPKQLRRKREGETERTEEIPNFYFLTASVRF